MTIEMTIQQSRPTDHKESKNVVMYGDVPTDNPNPMKSTWFERYYPTLEKAEAFATKRGWTTIVEGQLI